MPKLSAYVPDDLWDEARAAAPTLNTSQLIQAGLRRYAEGEKPSRRPLPADVLAQIEAIRRQKVEQAEQRYQRGFTTGLQWAAAWPWWGLDKLAGVNWDIRAWMRDLVNEDSIGRGRQEWWMVLNIDEPSAEIFYEDMCAYQDESVFRQGVQDALREVWNAVRQDQLLGEAQAVATSDQAQPDAD